MGFIYNADYMARNAFTLKLKWKFAILCRPGCIISAVGQAETVRTQEWEKDRKIEKNETTAECREREREIQKPRWTKSECTKT